MESVWLDNASLVNSKAYDFDIEFLNLICNYLLGQSKEQKNLSFSTWSKIGYGVPLGTILGPLIFNINTLDIFFEQKNVKCAVYADDNTPYFCGSQ